jgi:hypothetical protein
MIDWFSGLIGYDASNVTNGRVIKLSRDGEILSEFTAWDEARGSYDSNLLVKADASSLEMMKAGRDLGFLCSSNCLKLSGNPTKFLQGHNILGPSVGDLGPILQMTCRNLPESLRPLDCDSEVLPSVKRTRMDITVMIDLGDHATVHDWLSHAATETRSRHGRAQQSGGTVYWGKNSTRWALKAYCKACELKQHPCKYHVTDEIMEWASRLLRLELVLRRPELKDRDRLDESLVFDFLQRIEVGMIKTTFSLSGCKLSKAARMTFKLWVMGEDVCTGVSRPTFYRQRREILDEIGVDISLTPSEQVKRLDTEGMDRNLFDVEVLKDRVIVEGPVSLPRLRFG